MAHMIQCEEGWVNLDYVMRVTRTNEEISGKLQHRYVLFGTDDQIISQTAWHLPDDTEDFAAICAPLVPATAGQTAVVISISEHWTGAERPTENDIESRVYPIIGWRQINGACKPVFPESVSGGDTVLIVMPDNSLLESLWGAHNERYDNLAAAKAAELERHQAEWDKG
jgi:hypothetical protein